MKCLNCGRSMNHAEQSGLPYYVCLICNEWHTRGATGTCLQSPSVVYPTATEGLVGPKKRAKYGNMKTEVDGITFDSAKEARRYEELKLMEAAGVICDLVLQPPYKIVVNDVRIGRYKADFAYTPVGTTRFRIVEDVKSDITRKHPVYRLKKKLVEAIYGFEIAEV